ncbi:hypothetical protein JCM10450v2_003094 [Rhodotorula kratochvilovae]
MSVPGAFSPHSDSDSDASFTSGHLAHLEGIAAMSSDDDPDFEPGNAEDDGDAFFIDDDDEDDPSEGEDGLGRSGDPHQHDDSDEAGEDNDDDEGGAGGAQDDRPQLRIGLNPITRSVMLIDDDGNARPLTAADLAGTNVSLTMIRNMLLRNLGTGARRGGRAARYDDDEDDEMDGEEDDDEDWGPAKQYYPIIEVPQENGMRLERGGAFGPPPRKYDTTKRRNWLHAPTTSDYLRSRELDFRRPLKEALGDLMLPNSNGVEVAQFAEPVYSGQYSADGTFFYAACKDYRVYMYDTSTAPRVGDKSVTDQAEPRSLGRYWSHRTSLKVQKIAQGSAANCSWTLTDAELSDDNQWLIYSSITPRVHMVRTGQGGDWGADDGEQHTLDFSAGSHYGFGIWSVRFSHDAREIVAGARSGLVLVYDVEAQRTTLRVRAHQDDTNAVAFASASDSNLLVSGSDDCFVKVWDRRSLDGERPSGTCVGHTEGVTFVAPKGDGRYILSNGKDQGMKLWDLRMMTSNSDFERLRLDRKSFSIHDFDYRYGRYAKPRFVTHPHDVSVMTYRGHAVLRTLIRCHFSPLATTGQRYVYTGSADGRIHVYSLDGRIVQVLDRAQAHPLLDRASGAYADPSELRLRGAPNDARRRRGYAPPIVRDVSWHPFEPKMMSTAWEDAGGVEGSIALHEWAGRGEALEDRVERGAQEARG